MKVLIPKIEVNDQKLPQDMAISEFQKWLDYKKTKMILEEGEDSADNTESQSNAAIIESIMSGDLVVNEDLTLTYKLLFPIKSDAGNTALESLTIKPRITATEVKIATKGLNKAEPFGLYIGYLSVLSGELKGLINKIDSTDFSLLQKLVGYFL